MNRLLILSDKSQEYAEALISHKLEGLEIHLANDTNIDPALLAETDIILGRPDLTVKILNHTQKVRWIQSSFAGIEPFCDSGIPNGCVLTGVKEIFGPLMSEYVFGYILALERNIFQMRQNQFSATWEKIPYRSLSELTIGICGLGSIGKHLATTASHFGMTVLGLSRSGAPTPNVDRTYPTSEILPFVPPLDYLVCVLPNTDETRHIVNEQVIQRMKSSAVLINVGRGATVDEQAVSKALKNGELRAAVLDVFEEEPLDASSPLWGLKNAYITPHNSATTPPRGIVNIFCENYHRYRQGKPLKYIIDLDRGY
ncbi:MAG: D-2-hydroxyacid dehydrogenase [Rhodothermaceae bacterium]|nr:D-2-hydroxyacid dehydrogenase [Rhodothermaceae bacterium]